MTISRSAVASRGSVARCVDMSVIRDLLAHRLDRARLEHCSNQYGDGGGGGVELQVSCRVEGRALWRASDCGAAGRRPEVNSDLW